MSKWRTLLAEEIARSQQMPFAYGSHDCLQFAARCVAIKTGVDHAATFGAYTDPADLLNEHGGVEGILRSILGNPDHPSTATDGDVVLAEIAGRQSAGIYHGGKFLFVRETGGLAALPRRLITGVWHP